MVYLSSHPEAPILLSPDGCWPHVVNEAAINATTEAGLALAWFNRIELAHDAPSSQRCGPVFKRWPELHFGALSVWAWGLHRSADALHLIRNKQLSHIGLVGHSRGGKSALLAGAADRRICATISHNSGTGGAASLQRVQHGSESLPALAASYPHWLGPHASEPSVQHQIETIDSLPLLRAIAPRGLCLLQASDDIWANPAGTLHNAELLRPVWVAHNASSNLQWFERSGGHAMTAVDWQRAATFMQQVVREPARAQTSPSSSLMS